MTDPTPEEEGWIMHAFDGRLAGLWPGSEDYGDDLEFPLRIAAHQCAEFAPTLEVGADVPDNYVGAQVLQARALVRAGIVGSGDQWNAAGESVTVYPLDWTVKALLRPKRGKPYLGGRAHSAGSGGGTP